MAIELIMFIFLPTSSVIYTISGDERSKVASQDFVCPLHDSTWFNI